MPELPEKVRAFISMHLEPESVQDLCRFQRKLEQAVPKGSVRWSLPEQLHLTLKFLGNVDVQELDELTAALRLTCQNCGPLQLRVAGLGGFPSLRSPRVIWVGLHGDLQQLQELQSQIELAVARWAEKAENRAFHPHLTLGRVRETATRHARRIGEVLEATSTPVFGEWQAEQFYLMRSQLSATGATHTVLATLSLSRSPQVKSE